MRLLWQWKAPAFIERRLDRITGHRTTIGSVSVTHRLELIAYDVRIAGAPPFESQTLARVDRVVIRLGGAARPESDKAAGKTPKSGPPVPVEAGR